MYLLWLDSTGSVSFPSVFTSTGSAAFRICSVSAPAVQTLPKQTHRTSISAGCWKHDAGNSIVHWNNNITLETLSVFVHKPVTAVAHDYVIIVETPRPRNSSCQTMLHHAGLKMQQVGGLLDDGAKPELERNGHASSGMKLVLADLTWWQRTRHSMYDWSLWNMHTSTRGVMILQILDLIRFFL